MSKFELKEKMNEYSLFLWIGVSVFFYHVLLCVLIIINVDFIKLTILIIFKHRIQ